MRYKKRTLVSERSYREKSVLEQNFALPLALPPCKTQSITAESRLHGKHKILSYKTAKHPRGRDFSGIKDEKTRYVSAYLVFLTH